MPRIRTSKKSSHKQASTPTSLQEAASSTVYPSSSSLATTITPTMATLAAAKKTGAFGDKDFSLLSENEHHRYAQNSKHIGHALLKKNPDGSLDAWQYALPEGDQDAPKVHLLHSFEEIARYGQQRWRAKGHDGKTFYARRVEHARIKTDPGIDEDESVDVAYFSESESGKEPFWGSSKPVPRFKTDLPPIEQEELDEKIKDTSGYIKGGRVTVDSESVRYRDNHRKRNPDQNTLMGMSARDNYELFFGEYEDVLSPELIGILQRAFSANIRKTPENHYRPEWLHALGFSLMPVNKEPQRTDNLGAGPKWSNTEMMVLERLAKWFSLNKKGAEVTIQTFFDMLLDTELINTINFKVSIEFQNRYVQFIQELDVFKKYPIFRKASDVAQITGVTDAILHGVEPVSISKVSIAALKPIPPSTRAVMAQGTAAMVHAAASASGGSSSTPDDAVSKPRSYPTRLARKRPREESEGIPSARKQARTSLSRLSIFAQGPSSRHGSAHQTDGHRPAAGM